MNEIEKLGFSVEEAAKMSGIGRTLIFSAIGNGQLLARKFGRRTVILREDLEAFLRALPARSLKDRDDTNDNQAATKGDGTRTVTG